jgi:hypothetical protein
MRSIWTPLLIVALINLNCFAESESGSLCIAPAFFDPKNASFPGLYCEAEKFSLKIDTQVMAWPIKESVKLAGLDLNTRHRVIVLCDHKPQQSFTFRFSEFKTKQLCLFLNDLYRTVQLSEAKGAPWCKCK